jgi:large subunit ribosomal protein L7/L12
LDLTTKKGVDMTEEKKEKKKAEEEEEEEELQEEGEEEGEEKFTENPLERKNVIKEGESAEEKQTKNSVEKRESTGKYKDLIKQIESLSLADLAELVKELEERFGVSARATFGVGAPTPGAAGAPAPSGPGAPGPVGEKAKFTVVLSSVGTNKIAVIKAVREIKPDLGLKDAKDFVEAAPKTVLEDVSKEDAEKAKEKLTSAGATVELK